MDKPGLDTLAAAGLYDERASNAADRLALLHFLVEQGCSVEEMQKAHAMGRLFALAGDRLIHPGFPAYTIEDAAPATGLSEDDTRELCRALGLPQPPPHLPVLTEADIKALSAFGELVELLGRDQTLGLARVVGSAAARIAEAEFAALRSIDDLSLAHTGSEERTGRGYAKIAALVPGITQVIDVVHRRHIEGVRRHVELLVDDAGGLSCGIGFCDLAGFTALSRSVPLDKLAKLLSAFEAEATSVVHDEGGRVVKFIGDAVMFVTTTPESAAEIACLMVRHPRVAEHDLQMRAAVSFGPVLMQDGDYFGTPVNLAARLLTIAAPGEVVADPLLRATLNRGGWSTTLLPAQPLRGFDGEVTPLRIDAVPAG
jgi:class 3 adenylate cyclase